MVEKEIKKDIIVLDLASVPNGWDIEKTMHLMKTQGILVVDTHSGGQMPKMLHPRKKLSLKVVDIKDYKDIDEAGPSDPVDLLSITKETGCKILDPRPSIQKINEK